MKLLTGFLLTFLLFAQTAQFPTTIAVPQQLGVVANGVTGTLNNSLTTSSTSANITNGTCTLAGQATSCTVAFQPYMFITVQNEIMQICSMSAGSGVEVLNFGIVGSACPSISGRGLDGSQIAAHTTPSFPNKITVSNNITAWTHMANGAEIRAIEANLQPVQAAGAICNGTNDDASAIQTAINNLTGYQELVIPGNCAIGSGLYTSSTQTGIHIKCLKSTTGNCLNSLSSFHGTMLSVYSQQSTFYDLNINCASSAATAIVFVNAQDSQIYNLKTYSCTGDNRISDIDAGPSTTLVGTYTAGSVNPVLTVTNAALAGLPLSGTGACPHLMIDYQKPTQESAFNFTGSGNSLTISGTLVYNHGNTSTVTCNATNNYLTFYSPRDNNSGQWGFDEFPGTDANSITQNNLISFGNASGGALLTGSGNAINGLQSEGNTGPAVQLGDANGGTTTNGLVGRVAAGTQVSHIADMENSTANYNAINSVCEIVIGRVEFMQASQLLYGNDFAGGSFCPSTPSGSATEGYGVDDAAGNTPQFTFKKYNGTIKGQSSTGWHFYNNAGTEIFFPIQGITGLFTGATTVGGKFNYISSETGSNSHIAGSLLDANGSVVPETDGLRVTIKIAHTLTGGASNDFAFNGAGAQAIGSHRTNASIAVGYSAGSPIELIYDGSTGHWLDLSQ